MDDQLHAAGVDDDIAAGGLGDGRRLLLRVAGGPPRLAGQPGAEAGLVDLGRHDEDDAGAQDQAPLPADRRLRATSAD